MAHRTNSVIISWFVMAVACAQDQPDPSLSGLRGDFTSTISFPAPPMLRDAGNQNYGFVTAPGSLPADVRAALAEHVVRAPTLAMAAANEPFSDGCLIQPGLPRHRLLISAVNDRFAIVHFEEGGFAPVRRVVLLSRDAHRNLASVLHSNTTMWDLRTPEAFLAALRSGALWADPVGFAAV